MRPSVSRFAALPVRPLAAVALAIALGSLLALAAPALSIGSARPLAPLVTRWALMLIVLWGLLLWCLRRSLAGPLLAVGGLVVVCGGGELGWGDFRPLGPLVVRIALVGLMALAYAGWIGRAIWRRHGREQDLRQLLAALRRLVLPTLAEREHAPCAVTQARAAQRQWQQLHPGAGWRARLRARRCGASLPWYLVLGAPHSGKSSLLAASSLRLLRCEGGEFDSAGADTCGWWLGERAVFVEACALAGDASGAGGDPAPGAARGLVQAGAQAVAAKPARPATGADQAWDGLLEALRGRGAELPLHGVVLTLECAELLHAPAEQRVGSAALMRRRLLQLHAAVGSRLPVYLVLTKADELTGFTEFFRAFDAHAAGRERDVLWGFTLPWNESGAQPSSLASRVRAEFSLLQQGLHAVLPACLQHEPKLTRRCRMFEFPHAHAQLARRLSEWLERVFAEWPDVGPRSRARPAARRNGRGRRDLALRGVFLGSCGAAQEALAGDATDARFIGALLRDAMLVDADLARPDDPRIHRRRLRRMLAGSAMLLAGWLGFHGLQASYARTRERLGGVQRSARLVQERVGAAVRVGSRAASPWQEALRAAQQLDDDTRGVDSAGLFDSLALQPVREAADGLLLRMQQTLLLPPLVRDMRGQLELAMQQEHMGRVLDTLQAYLMLHDAAHYDPLLLHAWAVEHHAGNDVLRALEHPVGTLQDPAALDQALVQRAREWLSRYGRGQRLWHLVRARLEQAQQPPPAFSIASAQAGQPLHSFELASGRGPDQGVDGWYGAQAWRERLSTHAPAWAERAAADDAWLLGEPATTASAEELAEELRHAYWLEYARRWRAFLGDIRPIAMPGLEQQLQLLRSMASEQSPLLDLVRKAWRELQPLESSETARADPVAQGLLALRAFAGGDADSPAARGLRQALEVYATAASMAATEIAAGQIDAGALAQARARLIAQAGSLPAPLGTVVSALADVTEQRVLGAGSGLARREAQQVHARMLGAYREQVAIPCARGLAGHFPLSRQGPDAHVEDFAGFFGPGGSAQRYFDDYLKPWVDTSRRPWRYRSTVPASGSEGLSALAAQELLRMLARAGPDPDAFARIARVRSALWRQEAAAPGWSFELSVPTMDPGLVMLRLQVDGQAMRYAHGPVQPWAARWPGPQAGAGTRLRLEPADGSAPIEFSAQGPWAWMHVLALGRRRAAGAGGGVDLEFGPAQRRAVLHLSGAEPNPWAPGVLEGFTCPR